MFQFRNLGLRLSGRKWPLAATFALAVSLGCLTLAQDDQGGEQPTPEDGAPKVADKQIIGAIAKVVVTAADVSFQARVDTGAQSTSLHVEEIEIENASEDPRENWGKKIRFRIKNRKGATAWIDGVIDRTVIVKTSERQDRRYKVPLKLRWRDLEKTVLVTLNDRSQMNYPVLLGRDFLRGELLVDVSLNDENEEVADEAAAKNPDA